MLSRYSILHTRFIYFANQTWGGKAWKGFVIAKNKYEVDRMYYYATVIQKLQKELGLRISSFPDLALMAQEYIDDDSECGTNTEEMTGEEILQLLMKHDREFLDKYEREHRKEYVFYRRWQHASLYQSFMSRETSRQININRGKQFLH